MSKRKKAIVTIIFITGFLVLVYGVLDYLTQVNIGDSVVLKVGQTAKVKNSDLEIQLEGIWGCNEGPRKDQGFEMCISDAKNPYYVYKVKGKEVGCEDRCFDDEDNILVHGYKVKELERGEDWTKIRVTKQ